MATFSSAAAPTVPPLPPKLYTPQRKGNIGAGKLYADEAAFQAAVEAHEQEKAKRAELMKERKQAQQRHRDRSNRQRNGNDETDVF